MSTASNTPAGNMPASKTPAGDVPPANAPATVAARPLTRGSSLTGGSAVGAGLVAISLVNLAIAAMLAFAPQAFFTHVGPYGARNDHYMRDLATFYAAFGAVGLIAYRRMSWRTPVLCCVAIEYALHSINHLADIGDAHPYWLGPTNFASLAITTGALVWLAHESTRPQEVQR